MVQNLTYGFCACSHKKKKKKPLKASFYLFFFTKKVSTVISILKEVKPSPDRKMIKTSHI